MTIVGPLFIGVGGVGFSVASGSLALAIVTPNAAAAVYDKRSWLALTANLTSGSFTGVDGLTMTVNSLSVQVNRASGVFDPTPATLGTDSVAATALDWTKAIDLDENAASFSPDPIVVGGQTISYDHAFLGAAGNVTIDIFGFVHGTVGFDFQTRTVDVDVHGDGTEILHGATLTTIALTVQDIFVGVPGSVGFHVTSGSLSLAMVKPAPPTTGPADTRSWLTLSGSLASGSLQGIDGLVLTVTQLGVEVNKGSQGSVAIAALNWNTALDLNGDGVYGQPADKLTVGSTTFVSTQTELRAFGNATIDIFGFVTGQISFSFETKKVDVDLGRTGGEPRRGRPDAPVADRPERLRRRPRRCRVPDHERRALPRSAQARCSRDR